MTNPIKNSLVFYRSFYESIKTMPEKEQLQIYNAIFEYSLNFQEPKLTGICSTIFTLIKPQLEANKKKYLNGTKGGEHGKKGGRPKINNPIITPKKPQNNPTVTPNVNVNVNDNVNDNEKKKVLSKNFDKFWTFYTPIKCNGRTVAKGSKSDAEKIYKQKIIKYSHDQIMIGLENYLNHCQKNGQLTKQATQFLKKDTFLDNFDSAIVKSDQDKTRSIQEAYNAFTK